MFTVRAALAAAAIGIGAQASVQAAESLTLDDAFARVIDTHPDFAMLRASQSALAAEVERAALTPSLTLAADAENALGTGTASGLSGVELTLSLASVIERGDKRAARISVAQRRLDAVARQRDAVQLDLLAEVARRYLDALAARTTAHLLREDLEQRQRLVDAAGQRARAGGAPAVVPLAAEAARVRVAADVERARRSEQQMRRRLAALWGEPARDFMLADVDLEAIPVVPEFDALLAKLAATPELRRFADESRLREARLQLARSARTTDVDWRLGVRRMQAEGDWGLVGSISIPLGSQRRTEPDIRAAEAELAAIEFARESEQRNLQATLVEAWSQLDLAASTALAIDSELLPALAAAAAAAERAFNAGATSHLEWAQLQSEVTAARRERLHASLAAHRALIELQRLTGQTFRVTGAADKEPTP